MNQVNVEYVDECALGSSYLRRAAAEVVLPHTYSKSYGHPCSGASSWSSPWIVTRWPVCDLVVFTSTASLPQRMSWRAPNGPIKAEPTGVHSIGDDQQLAEDFRRPFAPGRARGGNEELTPPLQDRLHRPTAIWPLADSRLMTETTKWSTTSATDARRQTTSSTWV